MSEDSGHISNDPERSWFDDSGLGLCLCCEERDAEDHDDALGQVCGECLGNLAYCGGALAAAGISGVTTEINS